MPALQTNRTRSVQTIVQDSQEFLDSRPRLVVRDWPSRMGKKNIIDVRCPNGRMYAFTASTAMDIHTGKQSGRVRRFNKDVTGTIRWNVKSGVLEFTPNPEGKNASLFSVM